MEYTKHKDRLLAHLLSAPFIYSVFFAFVILDLFVEIYHRFCFPLYRIQLVDRSKYIRIDRHHLKYLSPMQKVNCMYCGYANGLIGYVREIAGRTEKYWCAIKHKKRTGFVEPQHHKGFVKYNDKQSYHKKFP